MKILIIANSTAGVARFRADLVKKISNNHTIYIATRYDTLLDDFGRLPIIPIEIDMNRRGVNIIQEAVLFFKYWKIISQINPDLVITYTIKPNIYGGLICRLKKIRYVANITGLGTAFQTEGFFKQMIIKVYRESLKRVNLVFFENAGNQNIFIENKIVTKENTQLLNGAGVNLSEFTYQTYPIKEEIEFLFMGRVMKEKGVEELFEAFKRLNAEYENVKLTLVGTYEEDYRSYVEELVKTGHIEYVGWVMDVKPYITRCSCAVLPSYHEGMSNTLLECAAMGRPLIASRIPGCQEAIVDGVSGYCVNKMDSYDLYLKMKQFVELSQQEKIEMGKASREHVEKVFDKKTVVKMTMEKMGL